MIGADVVFVAMQSSQLMLAHSQKAALVVSLLFLASLVVGTLIAWGVIKWRTWLWLRITSAMLLGVYITAIIIGSVHMALSPD